MRHIFRSTLLAVFLFWLPVACVADTYTVGKGQQYETISAVGSLLKAGDTVQIASDIVDEAVLARHGTSDAPIVIRGKTSVKNGTILRPTVRPALPRQEPRFALVCRGDWYVIEGLDFSGEGTPPDAMVSGLQHSCDNLTIRNCRFHYFAGHAIAGTPGAGNVSIEFCEFDSNGSTSTEFQNRQTVDLFSDQPMALAAVEHCYFHHGTGGNLLNSRFPRNVIRYNWFESPYFVCLYIIDSVSSSDKGPNSPLYPMHSDIVGNVFFQGWSPGVPWSTLRLGGEDRTATGTEGDFNIAHNLFVNTNGGLDPGTAIGVQGNVDKLKLYNNAFLDYGTKEFKLYWRGNVWEGPRTERFRARRGHGEPIISGSNNWVSTKAVGIPEGLARTIRGLDPGFVDLLGCDFRPRKGSPPAGAGLWPLPRGRIVDLVPEYEPQRGIPLDLEPAPRREATPPSIGPFETAE